MIDFIQVKKKYRTPDGHKIILRELDTRFPKRNIAILGENGAGKSTLLKLIAGAELPDEGRVKRNVNVSFPLGFSGSFNGSLTGIENTRFVARIYGRDTEFVIDYVKEFAELSGHFNAQVRTYSSGMRARLAFGVSLAMDFECYLVDEITAVGDQRFRKRSQKAFADKLTNANIIMVSHSMPTLREYCDMAIILRDGNVTFFDDLEEAIEDHEYYMDR